MKGEFQYTGLHCELKLRNLFSYYSGKTPM
jgi:hypothetical protein